MKWPVYLHSSTALIGKNLSPEMKMIFNFLMKELVRYLTAFSLKEQLMRDFLRSWNEINTEIFLPVLHQLIKYIRHRLLDSDVVAYHRLIHLVNALVRNCGLTAQVLVGREKFLRTIVYLVNKHKNSDQILAKETAAFSYKCFEEWQSELGKRNDLFPHYSRVFEKMSNKHRAVTSTDLSGFVITNVEKNPVQLDEDCQLPSLGQKEEATREEDKALSITVTDEDKSVELLPSNMMSDRKLSYAVAPSLPAIKENNTTTSSASPSQKSENLQIVVQSEQDDHSDESTAADPFIGDLQESQNDGNVPNNHESKRMSTATVYYDRIYSKTKSEEINNNAKNTALEVDSPHGKSASAAHEGMDITFKYYGTQRVVSYKKSDKNLFVQ